MDNQKLEKIRRRQKYNKLLFQITQYNLSSRKPPDELIKEAKKLGHQLDIPEAELNNIEYSTF